MEKETGGHYITLKRQIFLALLLLLCFCCLLLSSFSFCYCYIPSSACCCVVDEIKAQCHHNDIYRGENKVANFARKGTSEQSEFWLDKARFKSTNTTIRSSLPSHFM